MASREGHRQISAQLTIRSAEGWDRYVELCGCDLTSLLEAIGRRLADERHGEELMAEVAAEARTIMHERKRRRRKR